MVNGLGGTPLMELYIMNNELQQLLEEKEIRVYRTFVGNYMTSLEMAGCSFTLLELDDELKRLLDAHCDTTALKAFSSQHTISSASSPSREKAKASQSSCSSVASA